MTSRDASDPQVRERLSRALGPEFELLDLLGRGGFAEVYEVKDSRLHRRLAVKVLRPDLAWTEGMLHRFEAEARALARLSHPNILPIHFVGDSDGLVYYAMPFVEGRSVGEILSEQGPIEPETAVQIIQPILGALHHAHDRGMIHRDIKPDNILVEKGTGRPLLVDFGIVRQMDDGPGTTGSGFVVGTPTYMSPEQALGQHNVDHRADLYAIGAMLYQMVTGAPPYQGETSQEVIGRHINDPVPSAHEANAAVPPWLSGVIMHAMAKRPDDRYQSAAEMAVDLGPDTTVTGESPTDGRRWIRHDDPTAIIPTPVTAAPARGGRTSSGRRATDPNLMAPRRRATDFRNVRTWRPYQLLLWVLFLAVMISAAGFFLLARPTFYLTNKLVLPITVETDAGYVFTVAAGGTWSQALPSNGLLLSWKMEPPVNETRSPMGEELVGNIRVSAPTLNEVIRREVRREVDAYGTDVRYFAPVITNSSTVPIRVSINAQSGQEGCYCLVPPTAVRKPLGYYVYQDRNRIRVNETRGSMRSKVFEDVSPQIDPRTGMLDLTIMPQDFGRMPPRDTIPIDSSPARADTTSP